MDEKVYKSLQAKFCVIIFSLILAVCHVYFSYYLDLLKEVCIDDCKRADYYFRMEDLNNQFEQIKQEKSEG